MNFRLPFILFITFYLNFSLKAQEQTVADVYQKSIQEVEQDTSYWNLIKKVNFNIQQIGLTNWAAGGESSIGFGAIGEIEANYEKEDVIWENRFRAAYGVLRQGDKSNPFEKTDDNLQINSRYSQKFSELVLMSAQILFSTQMDKGFNIENANTPDEKRVLISDFMAPGYMQASLGLTYRRNENYFVTLSPFTGRFTFVLNDSLSNAGAFGVDPGQMIRSEAGISLTSSIKTQLLENVDLRFTANLFSNYERFPTTVVNALAEIDMKVNSFIGAKITSQVIYDEDVLITFNDGSQGDAWQFKNVINVGFNFSF